MGDNLLKEEAFDYVKKHKKDLIDCFVKEGNFILGAKTNFFMAGSPGVGKTEFVKSFKIEKNNILTKPLHIDADLIRTDFLKDFYKPSIDGDGSGNSHLLQKASIKGVEILLDYCLHKKILFILDGTMGGSFDTADKNIERCLKQKIKPVIFYLYQDPLVAWDYTKKRELVEGRNILKENFIKQFLKSKENVNLLKNKYKNNLTLNLIIKNFKNNTDVEKVEMNIESIDFYIKNDYTLEKLNNKLL